MAILVKLNGALGAIVAVFGICLPGSLLMFKVGVVSRAHGGCSEKG
jgi:chromate transporter